MLIPDSFYNFYLGDSIDAFRDKRRTCAFLLGSAALASIQRALGLYLSLAKELVVNSRAYFIGAIFNILLNILLVKFGMLYAALSTLISYFAIVAYIAIRVNSKYIKIFTLRK